MFDYIFNYFSTVNWTSPATISGLVIVSAVITFSILERFFPYNKLPYFRKGWYVDLIWYTFIQSYVLGIVIFTLIIGPVRDLLQMPEQGVLSHWPLWALVLFFFVTHDFYIYWFHRLQHNSKWLWRTHEAHHSVEQVDFLAGSRSHPVEILINQTVEFAPIILLLDPATGITVKFIKAAIDAVWGQFIHSNLNVRLGPFGYIINGPEHHQWHHAEHVEVYHANYGTKLAIWDWLFRTMYLPGKRKPEKYGLWYAYPRDYFMQNLFSVYRFNIEKTEKSRPVSAYLNLRISIINAAMRLLGKTGWNYWKNHRPLSGDPVYKNKPELADLPK